MADVLETIDKTETLLIVVAIGVGVYLLYQASSDFQDWIGNLIGASPENSYSNAAQQTLAHPVTTLGSIIGLNQGSPGGQSDLPSDISSTGYMKKGASGQVYSCTGPVGSPNDACVKVTLDASGNATITGPGGKAVDCN